MWTRTNSSLSLISTGLFSFFFHCYLFRASSTMNFSFTRYHLHISFLLYRNIFDSWRMLLTGLSVHLKKKNWIFTRSKHFLIMIFYYDLPINYLYFINYHRLSSNVEIIKVLRIWGVSRQLSQHAAPEP